MAYSLSFSPEFFLNNGEPYDTSELSLNAKGKPTTVWSAICLMAEKDKKRWKDMAREVFGLKAKEAKFLMAEAVLEKVQETNTCSNLNSPVEVWIDEEGDYRIQVWE